VELLYIYSDVEFAIIEPNGNRSVIPKSQARPVLTRDLQINTEYEGLALPLILDGEIQYNNLKYAGSPWTGCTAKFKKPARPGPTRFSWRNWIPPAGFMSTYAATG
jgi:uncharacterized membrane protein YcaP (DUF421 family)